MGFTREIIMNDINRFKTGIAEKYNVTDVVTVEIDPKFKDEIELGYMFNSKNRLVQLTMPYIKLSDETLEIKDKNWILIVNHKKIERLFKTLGEVFDYLGE